jgi:signal peptidase I
MTSQANLTDRETEEVPLPEWLTLHEAAFITRLSEEELRVALASAGVGSVSMVGRRSRARHAGRSLFLVRTDDLREAGLLEPANSSAPAAEPTPQPKPTPSPARSSHSIWTDDEYEDSIFGQALTAVKSEEIFGPSPPSVPPASRPSTQEPPTQDERPRRRPSRHIARRIARGGLFALLAGTLAMAACLVAFSFAPIFFGYHTFVMDSGTMSPAIRPGALLLERSIPPSQAKAGDVVTFRDPKDPSQLITSRVTETQVIAGVALFTTKGDGATASEEWSVPVGGRINRVSTHIGRLGGLVAWLRTGIGLLVLALTPLAVMLLLLLTRGREASWASSTEDPFWRELSGQSA